MADLTSTTGKFLDLVFLHDIFTQIIQSFGLKVKSDDPKLLKTMLNELSVGHFRILFREKYPAESEILDIVLDKLIESDQVILSLIIYTYVQESARLVPEGDRMYTNQVEITTPKKEKEGGIKGDSSNTVNARVFCDENYEEIIADLQKTIAAERSDDRNTWVKNVIKSFDKNGWIGGNALIRLLRLIKDKDLLGKLIKILQTAGVEISEFFKENLTEMQASAANLRKLVEEKLSQSKRKLADERKARALQRENSAKTNNSIIKSIKKLFLRGDKCGN